ncbi:calcium-binding and coiled-coil domain-containing protein 1 [Protobothrops mucrosquamatus]|uniref:calcium-binding and coiled-coil domain-containing protein 1 n=1 Tax=Protobothrops mucrosquamatus TaxID=103944 RepID=UPI0010FBBB57|nr:calcium-binding and coiled-coil domain-containing protein 1 [Protobothrops mucrosquamatus]
MEEAQSHPSVLFLNVASSYIPHTKVECHYNLPPGMKPSTRDWIGIFKVDASSVRDYYTFVWGIMPDGGASEGTFHCSVQFQASYLPKPGPQQYHFRYVDRHGEMRGQSSPFQFSEPRPMDELVTLEEASDDGGGTDMLLVVPKATVLELVEVPSCLWVKDTVKSLLREQEHIHHQLKEENAEKEQYQVKLQASKEESRSLASDLQEAKSRHGEKISQALMLQEDIQKLQQKLAAANCRTAQMESLCEQLRTTQDILAASQQKVALLGEELASVASIRDRTISDLHKSRLEAAEINIKLADMTLKWKEGKGHWWKEKAMLLQNVEVEKDKILKLSAEVLRLENSLQEERAQRQVLRMELAQERDASLVQVSESRRELRELRAALQVAQKEKEQLQDEKQELLVYIRRLEERLEKVADEKWSESVLIDDEEERALDTPGSLDSPLSDSEDECPEDMRLPAQLSSYSLCDTRAVTTTPPCAHGPSHTVVISQPAPIASQIKQPPEDSSSDSEAEDEKVVLMAAAQSGGEETNLLLPELGNGFCEMASGLTGRQMSESSGMGASPLDLPSPGFWKECPICHERFPPESDKETVDTHVDGHFFFSTHDPFTFE